MVPFYHGRPSHCNFQNLLMSVHDEFEEAVIVNYCRSSNKDECFYSTDGDLGRYGDVKTAYMKQKHRLIWERRHGKVGSGMKTNFD